MKDTSSNSQQIILIGFMGCGKSTLGKKLANKMNVQFLDSDKEIEKSVGFSVSEIFEKHGEDYFRKLEHEFLLKLKKEEKFVLSTGGGMPCFNDNIKLLKEIGDTIYLKLSPNELTRRLLAAKTKRPLVEQKSPEELLTFVSNKLEERNHFYLQASFILNGKEQNVKHILDLLS